MKKIIVALDNLNTSEIDTFLKKWQDTFSGILPVIKIGLELFNKLGPDYIHKINKNYSVKIFLDLKLHDIPNTVSKSIQSLEGLSIKFLTLHLCGGLQMLTKSVEMAKKFLPETSLLGVSYLTSHDTNDFKEIWGYSEDDIPKAFERLFLLAIKSQLHGIVSSPFEIPIIKRLESQHHTSLIKVTPGIRFQDEIEKGQIQDQKRVMSVKSALQQGSDYLVIGRSLTQATNLDKRIKELAKLS